MTRYDAAIVGAGFSGTMVAVNLARQSKGALRLLLIERGEQPGRGVAYGTTDIQHLLNVRAGQMGAFAEDPGHFHNWLQSHPQSSGDPEVEPDSFMPRLLYGAYLRDVLHETTAMFGGIETIRANVTDLVPLRNGYELRDGAETLAEATRVVLALGNFPPGDAAVNPYSPAIHARLAEPGDVFLIGTGLTSLDLLVTMARTKPQGRIHVVSRGGLFPQVHNRATNPYSAFLDREALPKTALDLLAAVRREIRKAAGAGIDWRDVVDSLRPLNQALWKALPLPEQRKFLRRLRSYWDSHRHRCAPEIMAAYDKFMAEGRLIRHRGAFVSMRETTAGMAVTWLPHGKIDAETITVNCAVDCTGPQSDLRKLDDSLIVNLLERDLLVPDPLRLGADTDESGALKNKAGQIVPGLFTLGSWCKGRLYESVAVPELRAQVGELAGTIIRATASARSCDREPAR